MNKSDIKPNDIVEFRNGHRATVDTQTLWVLNEYYDDDLVCSHNDNYTIDKVFRPRYEEIYDRDERELSVMELKKEILDLYDNLTKNQ